MKKYSFLFFAFSLFFCIEVKSISIKNYRKLFNDISLKYKFEEDLPSSFRIINNNIYVAAGKSIFQFDIKGNYIIKYDFYSLCKVKSTIYDFDIVFKYNDISKFILNINYNVFITNKDGKILRKYNSVGNSVIFNGENIFDNSQLTSILRYPHLGTAYKIIGVSLVTGCACDVIFCSL